MKQDTSNTLLYEIGVEEIPSAYFSEARASIDSQVPVLLMECGFSLRRPFQVFITPRRIVVYAELKRNSESGLETRLGPSREQCYKDGLPTPALLGFLKSTGKKITDIEWVSSPKGERALVKIKKEVKPLRYFFETLPFQIAFPKLMRWDKTNQKFVRPIRWTFAFVGNKVQKYHIAGVTSGSFTYGHRILAPKRITVKNSDVKIYEKLLLSHHVILKPEERIRKIKAFLKGSNNSNEALVETVANLVEEPFPVRGTFEKKYLKLPASVLTTCMSKNQKTFACYEASDRPKNHFIAIINGPRKGIKQIAKNHESVLKSRLEDAEFFFHEDQKSKLEAKVEKLKEMIFLGSLGTYRDKTKRVEALAKYLGSAANLEGSVVERGIRAAHLAKADLMTHLVYEFPELQGMAGSEYARLNGEPAEVARAISGHYLPASLSENYNDLGKRLNLEGALVGLCDRIDLLVGATGLGIEVSGSQDPYALRRAAGGIVKILRAHLFDFSLSKWIHASRDQYGSLISKSKDEIVKKLKPFFKERIVFELQLKIGTKEYNLLQGIFASDFDNVSDVYRKFGQLSREINHKSFINACKVAERTGNILKGVKAEIIEINPNLLNEPIERRLFEMVQREEPSIFDLISKGNYSASAKAYGDKFYGPVHEFFDQVMVNVEDPKIRANRQALVKRINSLCADKIADLSQVSNS